MTWNAAGQAAGCRGQNEKEKSKTSPNLRVALPQFSTLGSLREQYFKSLNLVSTGRRSNCRCTVIGSPRRRICTMDNKSMKRATNSLDHRELTILRVRNVTRNDFSMTPAEKSRGHRKCPYCGTQFTLNSPNQKFCSYQCRWDNRAELRTHKRRSTSEGESGLK